MLYLLGDYIQIYYQDTRMDLGFWNSQFLICTVGCSKSEEGGHTVYADQKSLGCMWRH